MKFTASHVRALELADQLHKIGPISVTRFFGGAGLVRAGVQFAFIIESVLYLRVDNLTRPDFEALGAAPFSYATRSKTVKVASYYELPDEIVDNPDELIRWATRASLVAIAAKSTNKRRR